jgi:hypothetical protein
MNWLKNLEKLSSENSAVKESEVLINVPSELHNDWDNFMRGKTCPILVNGDHGIYPWDLKQFVNKLK